jgi:hypothetical protein
MSIYDKKIELLKSASNKALVLAKTKKKSNPHLKSNISLEHHSTLVATSKDKLKQKENIFFRQISRNQSSSNKKIAANHRSQNSDFSEQLKHPYRLKTELGDSKTSKFDMVRFNTEVGEGFELFEQRSTMKKKGIIPKKAFCYTSNLLKTSQKPKLISNNID